MSESKDGGPAFPTNGKAMEEYPEEGWMPLTHGGMSLRDYFASSALATMKLQCGWSDNPLYWDGVAKSAYACADAMLRAREATS